MTKRKDLHLVRDVLDTQVLDREKRPMGKVDGIGLELRDGAPPRVAYFEIDGVTAWRRLRDGHGRWAATRRALRPLGGGQRGAVTRKAIPLPLVAGARPRHRPPDRCRCRAHE